MKRGEIFNFSGRVTPRNFSKVLARGIGDVRVSRGMGEYLGNKPFPIIYELRSQEAEELLTTLENNRKWRRGAAIMGSSS